MRAYRQTNRHTDTHIADRYFAPHGTGRDGMGCTVRTASSSLRLSVACSVHQTFPIPPYTSLNDPSSLGVYGAIFTTTAPSRKRMHSYETAWSSELTATRKDAGELGDRDAVTC